MSDTSDASDGDLEKLLKHGEPSRKMSELSGTQSEPKPKSEPVRRLLTCKNCGEVLEPYYMKIHQCDTNEIKMKETRT